MFLHSGRTNVNFKREPQSQSAVTPALSTSLVITPIAHPISKSTPPPPTRHNLRRETSQLTPTMLPRLLLRRQLFTRATLVRSYATAPTPVPPKADATAQQPKSNEPEDGKTTAVVENADVAERARTMQAPNRSSTWSGRQNPREVAMSGPRFEQTIMELQVCPSLRHSRWIAIVI